MPPMIRSPGEISAIAMQMANKQNGVIEAMLRKLFNSGMSADSIHLVSSYCQCRGVHVRDFPEAYWSFVEYNPDTFMFTFSEGWADRCPHMIGPLLPDRSDIDMVSVSGMVTN